MYVSWIQIPGSLPHAHYTVSFIATTATMCTTPLGVLLPEGYTQWRYACQGPSLREG
jgi:hypothetical protein